MIWQSAQSGDINETAFRAVRNSTTRTSTVTIAKGTPMILETATASANGAFAAQAAAAATAVINNLYIGQLHADLAADAVGLVQTYGVDTDAIVATAGASVGAVLVPTGTNLSTSTSVFAPAAILTVLVAPSGATAAATSVFIRAL